MRLTRHLMRPLAAPIAVIFATGCASSQSLHVTTSAAPEELTWRYDGDLKLQKGQRHIDDLDELAREVAGVPAARRDAEQGADLAASGNAWGIGGAILLLTGLVAGTTMIVLGAVDKKNGLVYGGLGALGFGLVVGGSFAGVGASNSSKGLALRLDAVNQYNDAIWRRTAKTLPRIHGSASTPQLAADFSMRTNLDGIQLWFLARPATNQATVTLRFRHYARKPQLDQCHELEIRGEGWTRRIPVKYELASNAMSESAETEIDLETLSRLSAASQVDFDLCGLRRTSSLEAKETAKRFETRFRAALPQGEPKPPALATPPATPPASVVPAATGDE